jgi:hypothetical protein
MGFFLFNPASKPNVRPSKSRVKLVPCILSLGVKRPEREADYSPPSSVEVNNAWNYTSTPPIRLHSVVFN